MKKINCCICTNYQNIIIKSDQYATNALKNFPSLAEQLVGLIIIIIKNVLFFGNENMVTLPVLNKQF